MQNQNNKIVVGAEDNQVAEKQPSAPTVPPRETWGSQLEFLMSIIGFAVDLANVWRFPYYCFKNGGGAFLIPYFLMLAFAALPLLYLELIMGQHHRQGAVGIWKVCPLFMGVGVAQNIISYLVALYYNVIIGWSFYFLFASFTNKLPWTNCWPNVSSIFCQPLSNFKDDNSYSFDFNSSNSGEVSLASNEYFERVVLGIYGSSSIDHLGPLKWKLVLCTLLVFCILYFISWKGVKSSGKVIYVTALSPYLILLILLINGLLLPGSKDGIVYFITPRFHKLTDPNVWTDAAIQIFYSSGAGFGVHVAYASYNKFNNNCYRDCVITSIVNSFTSLFSGCVVFSYLGYMANLMKKEIDDVATEGPGLVFQIYPFALATLKFAPFFSVLFFLLLISLGLDSAMGGLESFLTGMLDLYRERLSKFKYYREVATAIVVFSAFLLSLPNLTAGGMYLFLIFDSYAAGWSLLMTTLFQAIGVSWFYGINNLCADTKSMLGFSPGIFWRICWKFLSPCLIFTIILTSISHPPPLAYKYAVSHPELNITSGQLSTLSSASMPIGNFLALFPLSFIVIIGIAVLTKNKSFALSISPLWDHERLKGGGENERLKLRHWFSLGPHDVWPFVRYSSSERNEVVEINVMKKSGNDGNSPNKLADH